MDWNDFSPYIVPLLVAAFLVRRAMREQKPKRVRFTRLWLFPVILLLVTWVSMSHESSPGILVGILFLVVIAIGGAIGWYRAHTLEFSLDPESGKVSARATQVGAFLIVGLIAFRWGAELALKKLGLNAGTDLVHASDSMLLLSTSMYVARSIHTWIRASELVAAHRATSVIPAATDERGEGVFSSPAEGGGGGPRSGGGGTHA